MNRHIISTEATLLDALEKLNRLPGGAMTLFAIDGDDRVGGTLTDGDVRRALLRGVALDSKVEAAMHPGFVALRPGMTDVEMIRDSRRRGITLLPRIDEAGHLVEIIDLNVTRNILPLKAVLMAGGKGERLRPLTLDTPKPLLEIDGKAIIDYNVEALAAVGITDITVTTRYLAEKIEAHFATAHEDIDVRCVREKTPLGTIGACALMDHSEDGNTLVMNSDLLTTISFEEMYLRHMAEHAAVTVAVIPYQVSVPYAILAIDGQRVTGIEEKPAYSHYANAGIYIFANRLLRQLPADSRTDATDLITQAIEQGERVTYYPISGTWIDVGSPTDFRQAGELMRHHRNLSTYR